MQRSAGAAARSAFFECRTERRNRSRMRVATRTREFTLARASALGARTPRERSPQHRQQQATNRVASRSVGRVRGALIILIRKRAGGGGERAGRGVSSSRCALFYKAVARAAHCLSRCAQLACHQRPPATGDPVVDSAEGRHAGLRLKI